MLVFSQKSTFAKQELMRQAERHFACRLEFDDSSDEALGVGVRMHGPQSFCGSFRVRARPATDTDRVGLEAAESANRSFGMADLARRCTHVWEVTVEAGASDAAVYYLAALLASVALGPFMPADRAGLFGVRSCRQRAQALADQPV